MQRPVTRRGHGDVPVQAARQQLEHNAQQQQQQQHGLAVVASVVSVSLSDLDDSTGTLSIEASSNLQVSAHIQSVQASRSQPSNREHKVALHTAQDSSSMAVLKQDALLHAWPGAAAPTALAAELSGLSSSFLSTDSCGIQIVHSTDAAPACAALQQPGTTTTAGGWSRSQPQHLVPAAPAVPACTKARAAEGPLGLSTAAALGCSSQVMSTARTAGGVLAAHSGLDDSYSNDSFEDPPAEDLVDGPNTDPLCLHGVSSNTDTAATTTATNAGSAGKLDVWQELEQLHRSLPLARLPRHSSSSIGTASTTSSGDSSSSDKADHHHVLQCVAAPPCSLHSRAAAHQRPDSCVLPASECPKGSTRQGSCGSQGVQPLEPPTIRTQHPHTQQQQQEQQLPPQLTYLAQGGDFAQARLQQQQQRHTAAQPATGASAALAAAATEDLLASLPVVQEGHSRKFKRKPSGSSTLAASNMLCPSVAPAPQVAAVLPERRDVAYVTGTSSKTAKLAVQRPTARAAAPVAVQAAPDVGSASSVCLLSSAPTSCPPGAPQGPGQQVLQDTSSTGGQDSTALHRSVAVQVGSMHDKGVQVAYDSIRGVLWDNGCGYSTPTNLQPWQLMQSTDSAAQASLSVVAAAAAAAAARRHDSTPHRCAAADAPCASTGVGGAARSWTLEQGWRGVGLWPATLQQLQSSVLLGQLIQQLQQQCCQVASSSAQQQGPNTQQQSQQQQCFSERCCHPLAAAQPGQSQLAQQPQQQQQRLNTFHSSSSEPHQPKPSTGAAVGGRAAAAAGAPAPVPGAPTPNHSAPAPVAAQLPMPQATSQWFTIPLPGLGTSTRQCSSGHEQVPVAAGAAAAGAQSAAAVPPATTAAHTGCAVPPAESVNTPAGAAQDFGAADAGWVVLPVPGLLQAAPASTPTPADLQQDCSAASAVVAAPAAPTPGAGADAVHAAANGWVSLCLPQQPAVSTGSQATPARQGSHHSVQGQGAGVGQANSAELAGPGAGVPAAAPATGRATTGADAGWLTLPPVLSSPTGVGVQDAGGCCQQQQPQQEQQGVLPQQQQPLCQQENGQQQQGHLLQQQHPAAPTTAHVGPAPAQSPAAQLDTPTSSAGTGVHVCGKTEPPGVAECAPVQPVCAPEQPVQWSAAVATAAETHLRELSGTVDRKAAGTAVSCQQCPPAAQSSDIWHGDTVDVLARMPQPLVMPLQQQQQQLVEQRVAAQTVQQQPWAQQQQQEEQSAQHAAPRFSTLETLRRYQHFLQTEGIHGAAGIPLATAAVLEQQVAQAVAAAEQRQQQQEAQPWNIGHMLQQLQQVSDALTCGVTAAGGLQRVHSLWPDAGAGMISGSYEVAVSRRMTNGYLHSSLDRLKGQVSALSAAVDSHARTLSGKRACVAGSHGVWAAAGVHQGGGGGQQLDQGERSTSAVAAGALQRDCYTTLEQTLAEIRAHRSRQ